MSIRKEKDLLFEKHTLLVLALKLPSLLLADYFHVNGMSSRDDHFQMLGNRISIEHLFY